MQGGKGGHAQVDLAPRQPHSGPAVLGKPSFGDIESRQQLDAGYDPTLQLAAIGRHIAQDAVQSEAHPQTVAPALQMHVAGPTAQGVAEDGVHQLHHRRIVGPGTQVAEPVGGRVGGVGGAEAISQERE